MDTQDSSARHIIWPSGCRIFFSTYDFKNSRPIIEENLEARYYTRDGDLIKIHNGVGRIIQVLSSSTILIIQTLQTIGPAGMPNVSN